MRLSVTTNDVMKLLGAATALTGVAETLAAEGNSKALLIRDELLVLAEVIANISGVDVQIH